MKDEWARKGLFAAAAMNVGGVLLFSRAFTNEAIHEADPVAMSIFGLLMIVVWGLAYAAAATLLPQIKWLAGVFAVEKLIYGVIWVRWLLGNDLGALYARDAFAGVFFSIYGLNDLLFMVFFGLLFFTRRR